MQSLHHPTVIPLPFAPHPQSHTLHFFNKQHISSSIFSTRSYLTRTRCSPPSPATTVVSTSSLWEKGPIEGVLFDIDGTLCDSDPLHFYAFRQMLQQLPNVLAEEQLEAIEGLDKVCKWIEERGIKRAAVTNAPRPNAELILSMLKLTDFFEEVIIGNECERAKPFPDPYLKALQALQLSPQRSFVFEDSVSGIKAGVGAGMRVVGVGRRNPKELLQEAGATFVIQDFNDPILWTQLLF
uniref:Haloacid dehalogenase-like hydrolase domain-containing protein Sgpp n=1 Tax=Cucumis sativus TaxID=3659 RepID=A0A0A0KBQ6_CUCSA